MVFLAIHFDNDIEKIKTFFILARNKRNCCICIAFHIGIGCKNDGLTMISSKVIIVLKILSIQIV